MVFEYQPIELAESKRIELPLQPISHKGQRFNSLEKLLAKLEKKRLGISGDLEIHERKYVTPIETEYPENNVGRVRHYKASNNSANSAVIVLPQRGSGYNIAQLLASYLASNGISAYEIETPFRGSRLPPGAKSVCDIPIDLDKLKRMFVQAITETRGLIDWIEEEKIGIFGVSFGAIYSSLVYGVDDRVSSACLALGGGNIADMVFKSYDEFAGYIKEYVVAKGISPEKLQAELKEIEPVNYTQPTKSENLLMINATKDKSVPEKYGKQLREAWGNPQQYLVNAGHLSIIRKAPELLQKILEHYRRTLVRI